MALDLFAELHVTSYADALPWYERLLGGPPTFVAHATEAVWELAEHRYLVLEELPEHAGHGQVTVFLDDLDATVDAIVARGIEPAQRETYDNGVRKVTFRDPEGNEFGYGGAPLGEA
jgi:predicted enzyme related to lactoylglutathione lyase